MRGGQGLPHGRHTWFQWTPADPSQYSADLLSQTGGATGKMHLRKGKTLHGTEKWGKRKYENSPADMKVREERGMLQVLEQRLPWSLWRVGADNHTAAHRGPRLEEVDISWRKCSLHPHWNNISLKYFSLQRGPWPEQGKLVRRKQQQRNYRLTTSTHFPSTLHCLAGREGD